MSNDFSILDSALTRVDEYGVRFSPSGSNPNVVPSFDEEDYMVKFALYEHEKISDGPYFDYKINLDGFRTKHLNRLSSDNLNILFAGCSFTHGAGLPSESSWPAKVTDMISNISDKNVDAYNIALGGSNVFQIVKNLRIYIDKYGKPDYVFVLFPGFERTIKYQNQNGSQGFIKVTINQPHTDGYRKNKAVKHFMDSYVIEESILFATEQIRLLEFLCKVLEIKLVWSTWSQDYKRACKELEFDSYIDVPSRGYDTIGDNVNNEPYWELARDLNHPGTGYHSLLADKFFDKFSLIYNQGGRDNV